MQILSKMDRPVAKVHPLDDVPRSLSFQLNGNGNPWPNPNDSGPDPKGGLSTVTSEYATPGYDEDDFSEFINYDPDGQAVVSRVTFVIQIGLCGFVTFSAKAWNGSLLLLRVCFPELYADSW